MVYKSCLQPGVREDILGDRQKHPTRYVKLNIYILFRDKHLFNLF
jgi:hypothetical protein